MAKYRFLAEGESYGRKMRIEFEFENDELIRASVDGVRLSAEDANHIFRLGEVYGPSYVPTGEPYSRLNALNFLRWEAFDREPVIGGDPGIFDIDETEYPEGTVF